MPSTPTYALPYPESGDPADVPADLLELVNRLEAIFPTLGPPVGTPYPWLVSTIPAGYIEFAGQTISQAAYPKLYGIFGGTLPDLRGRVLMGQDGTHAIGTTGGEAAQTLDISQVPSHTHAGSYIKEGYGNVGAGSGFNWGPAPIDPSGGGASHNNLQPYRTVRWITVAA